MADDAEPGLRLKLSNFRAVMMFKTAFRENFLAGMLIQIPALMLVLSYYFVPAVATACTELMEFKRDFSLAFAVVLSGIFGGAVPFLVMWRQKKFRTGMVWANFWFYLLFMAYRGGEVELFYRLQSYMFGNDCSAGTIVKKVLFDQFVYNPFWGAHVMALGFLWRRHNFSFRHTRRNLDLTYFTEYFPGMQFSVWIVWIPAVSIIYCLPLPLQLPLCTLMNCFFVLVAASLKRKGN